jgi:hypothetical protein
MEIERVAVPDLVGQFVHIARDEVLKLGLDLAGADPDGVPITAATWPGLFCITTQDPAAGTLLSKGDQIRVTWVREGQARGDVAPSPDHPLPFLSAHAEPDSEQ